MTKRKQRKKRREDVVMKVISNPHYKKIAIYQRTALVTALKSVGISVIYQQTPY